MYLSVKKNYVVDNCYYLALNWDNGYNGYNVDFNSIMHMLKIDDEFKKYLEDKYNLRYTHKDSYFIKFETEQDVINIIEELEPYLIMEILIKDSD